MSVKHLNEVKVYPHFDGITPNKQIPVHEETLKCLMHMDEVNSNFIVEIQMQRKLSVVLAVGSGVR